MDSISLILHQFDYDKAFKLYDELTGPSVTKTLLSRGENVFNTKKLKEELLKLQQEGKGTIVFPEKEVKTEVADLVEEWKKLYKEASFLQQKLLSLDKEPRRLAALKILELFDDITDIWDRLKHFDDTGTLPEERHSMDIKLTSKEDLLKRRNTLRTYISKARAGIKPTDRIAGWEMEIKQIEKLL